MLQNLHIKQLKGTRSDDKNIVHGSKKKKKDEILAPDDAKKDKEEEIETIANKQYLILENTDFLPMLMNFKNFSELIYLNLSQNPRTLSVHHLDMLVKLGRLIKLDLSYNNLDELPDVEVLKELLCLRVLYLHGNQFKELMKFDSISSIPGLVYLTLYENPISIENENLRQIMISKCLNLKAYDMHIISDKERLKNDSMYKDIQINDTTLLIDYEMQIKWPLYTIDKSTKNDTFILKTIYAELSYINSLHYKKTYIIKIQKYIRGFLTRTRLRLSKLGLKTSEQENKLKLVIQKWKKNYAINKKLREFLKIKGKEEYLKKNVKLKADKLHMIVHNFCERIRKKVFIKKTLERLKLYLRSSYENIFSINKTTDIFFDIFNHKCFYILKDHMPKFELFIQKIKKYIIQYIVNYDDHKLHHEIFDNVEIMKNLMVLRVPEEEQISTKGILPMIALLRMYMNSALKYVNVDDDSKYDRFLFNIQQINIKRKVKYRLNNAERQKMIYLTNRLDHIYENRYCRFYKINIYNLKLLHTIIRHLQTWNKEAEQSDVIYFFLDEGIKRVSAAVKIQSAYRRYKDKGEDYKASTELYKTIRRNRAAIVIQRWCRNIKFIHRLYFLTELNIYLRKLHGRTLYIEEDIYVHLMGIIVILQTMRMKIKDQDIKIMVDPRNFNHFAIKLVNSSEIMPYRVFLPNWINIINHDREKIISDFYEGDAMHLLHLGTLIKKKFKNGIKYLKIMFKDKESALYNASVIALQTFTNRNSGFFIKLMDKKMYNHIKETMLKRYHDKIYKLYNVLINNNNSLDELTRYTKYNDHAFKKNFYDNCGFLFSKNQNDFKVYALTIKPEHIKEIKVRSSIKVMMKTKKENVGKGRSNSSNNGATGSNGGVTGSGNTTTIQTNNSNIVNGNIGSNGSTIMNNHAGMASNSGGSSNGGGGKGGLMSYQSKYDIIYFVNYPHILELQLQVFNVLNSIHTNEDELPSSRNSMMNLYNTYDNITHINKKNNIKEQPLTTFLQTQIDEDEILFGTANKSRPFTSFSHVNNLTKITNLTNNNTIFATNVNNITTGNNGIDGGDNNNNNYIRVDTTIDLKKYLVRHTNQIEDEFKKKKIFLQKLHSSNLKKRLTSLREDEINKAKSDVQRRKENTVMRKKNIQDEKTSQLESILEKNSEETNKLNESMKRNEQKLFEERKNQVDRLKYGFSVEMKAKKEQRNNIAQISQNLNMILKEETKAMIMKEHDEHLQTLRERVKFSREKRDRSKRIFTEFEKFYKRERQTTIGNVPIINMLTPKEIDSTTFPNNNNSSNISNNNDKSIMVGGINTTDNEIVKKKNTLPELSSSLNRKKLSNPFDMVLPLFRDVNNDKGIIRNYEAYMNKISNAKGYHYYRKSNDRYNSFEHDKTMDTTIENQESMIVQYNKQIIKQDIITGGGGSSSSIGNNLAEINPKNVNNFVMREESLKHENTNHPIRNFLKRGDGLNVTKTKYFPGRFQEEYYPIISKPMNDMLNTSSFI